MNDYGTAGNTPRTVYADIIDRDWEPSAKHPRMSLHDRAAQFAPFAALTGYDEMVVEEARLTESVPEPGESDLERLDAAFRILSALLARKERPEVNVLFFVPDERKAGGRYETVTAQAEKIDPHEKKLVLRCADAPAERISLDMDRILGLSGDCLCLAD